MSGYSSNVLASTYSISMTVPKAININVSSSGNGATISASSINVISTCPSGYTVNIQGPDDTTLYIDGDSVNNATNNSDSYIAASTGTTTTPVSILGNNLNTWGYSLTSTNATSGTFIGLTNQETLLTSSNSATSASGVEIPVYYGVSVDTNRKAGTYKMADNGTINYTLVTNLDCTSYQVRFNANGGTGTMANQRIAEDTATNLAANEFTRNGYNFVGWNTEQDGSGDTHDDGEAVTNLTTVGDVVDLYAIWERVYVMQEVSEWKNDLEEGDEVGAIDIRDGKTYTVAKLADGNIWMTQNLDHDIGDINGGIYTPDDTDIPENWVPDSDYYTRETENTDWCSVSDCNIEPESYDPGNGCWLGEGEYDYDDTCENRHYHLGNYYNWTAAVAMSDSSSLDGVIDMDQSVCPAGWSLPKDSALYTTDQGTTYRILLTNYGFDDLELNGPIMWGSPLYFPLSGYWHDGIDGINEFGGFWSSVTCGSDSAYFSDFESDGTIYLDIAAERYLGLSLRCVVR